jgi:perosamine synthetase
MWESRKNIARKYTEALKDNNLITLHGIKKDRESSWHLFPIRLKLEYLNINRAQLIDEMRKLNVGVGVHFLPVHQHLYYSQTFNLNNDDYPVASNVFPRLISLPIYPGMSPEHVDRVINVLVDLLNKYKK